MCVIKSILFAIVWGVFVLGTTFLQIITKGDLIWSEFDFGNVGICIVSVSMIFLLDFFITYNFSPFKKLKEGVLNIIMFSAITAFLVILIGQEWKLKNLYTIIFSITAFIIAKAAILWCYADMTTINADMTTIKKARKVKTKLIDK